MEEQELESGKIKKFIYVNRKAPHGSIYAHEALEVVLIAAAFEQDVSLAFIDDGVYQLKKGQDTEGIATKNFTKTFGRISRCEILPHAFSICPGNPRNSEN